MNQVKSITTALRRSHGPAWNVRCRLVDGTERWLTEGAPYTLAQAELACLNAQRDVSRHGVTAVFHF